MMRRRGVWPVRASALVAALVLAGPALAAGDRALGEYLSAECSGCHQANGRRSSGIPAIAGLPADQFVALLEAYRSRRRDNAAMQAVAARLSPEEIAALAAYYETLGPRP